MLLETKATSGDWGDREERVERNKRRLLETGG
jgi:hypothetical protein